jgi:prepilin-type N-terminal cleavage/methylation domain-containing protein
MHGFTLIEVIGVILLLSLLASALLTASSRLAAHTTQALQLRQTLAFSQSVLEEVLSVPFDAVIGYQGQTVAGTGAALAGCSAAITLTPTTWGGIAALDAAGQPQVLRVQVAVQCPGQGTVAAEGLRIRHAS